MFISKEIIIKICAVFLTLQDSLVSGTGVRVVGYWTLNKKYLTDFYETKVIHVSEYCELPACPIGSHVVCEVFNPTAQFGSKCESIDDTRITPEYAQLILDYFNGARAEVALGKATGKGDSKLPRAYGMMKLKWDNELATFAQLLANRCSLVYDHCRSTKKFPSPVQITCEINFDPETWLPYINSNNKSFTNGFSEDKIKHAIEEVYLREYHYKKAVTINMVKSIPDWTNLLKNGPAAIYYLNLIHSKASHVGCGISSYKNSATTSGPAVAQHVHTVLIVCNLSHKPKPGGKAYDTDPPVKKNTTTFIGKSVCRSKAQCTALYKEEELTVPFSKCGCPVGTVEDENCLCDHSLDQNDLKVVKDRLSQHRNRANKNHDWNPHKTIRNNQGAHEEKEDCSTAVLLPIITEDGINIQPEEFARYFMSNLKSTDTNDGNIARTRYARPKNRYLQRKRKSREMNSHRRIPSQRYSYKHDLVPAERAPEIIKHHDNPQDWSSKRRSRLRNKNRQSIFTRARTFHLPLSNMSKTRTQNDITRKDFLHTNQFLNKKPQREESVTELKSTLVTSLDNKDKRSKLSELSDIYQVLNSTNEPKQNYEYQTENKTSADFAYPSKLNNINKASNEKNSNEEPHKNSKLLHLINIIEKEIRNSKLNGTEKEKIHTKIKRLLSSLHEESNVPNDVQVLRHSKTMHNVEEDLMNQNDYTNEAEAEDYIDNIDKLSKRHHQPLLAEEPSFLMPIDERETKFFNLPVDISERELTAKEKESEEVTNDEFSDIKTQEPQNNYNTEIDDDINKEIENIDTRYRKQNTDDNDEIYTKKFEDDKNKHNKYEKYNIKTIYDYEDISNSYFTDNDRIKNKYEKNYTTFDYDEDPLDEERRIYYQRKLEEMRNKQRYSDQKDRYYLDLQNQPAPMQRRMKNLAVSRAQAARYYEPDQDRFIQGY